MLHDTCLLGSNKDFDLMSFKIDIRFYIHDVKYVKYGTSFSVDETVVLWLKLLKNVDTPAISEKLFQTNQKSIEFAKALR